MHFRFLKLAALAPLTLLVACASKTGPGGQQGHPDRPALVQVWEYPASEFPTMCMLMHDDGSLLFRGGFAFFNPGKWRTGASPGELIVTLGGITTFPLASANDEIRRKNRPLRSVDPTRRELVFKLSNSPSDALNIGGFYFLRATKCSAV